MFVPAMFYILKLAHLNLQILKTSWFLSHCLGIEIRLTVFSQISVLTHILILRFDQTVPFLGPKWNIHDFVCVLLGNSKD